MNSNKLRIFLRNIEKYVDKYGLLILILLFIFGPKIINLIFKENITILSFTKSEMLDYYGVVISGIITFLVLRATINNSNESLNKQIEIQNKIMNKQFEFELRQKQVGELEEKLKNILDSCKIPKNAISAFNKIPNYLSITTLNNILIPLYELCQSIGDLVPITDDVYNKFELTLNSFIIIDELINCEKYKSYKATILNYINNYLDIIKKLNQEIQNINNLIVEINSRKQYNYIITPINDEDIGIFANLKSNLNYYMGSHNVFRVVGWIELNKEISEFIKFLNRYIMNSID